MRNKGFIVVLVLTISVLCLLFLSFTYFSRRVKTQARQHVEKLRLPDSHYQKYLDSVWNEHVIDIFGISFTYKEIKEKELNLGLDLQGGMHLIMEVSPMDIVLGLTGNTKDEYLLRILRNAEQKSFNTESFVKAFYNEHKKFGSGKPLSSYFVSAENKADISVKSSDSEVLDFLQREIDAAVDVSFQVLRNRIDRFGVANPNIQRLPGTQRIQVELSGIDSPERIRKLLQSLANLEFWEVYEINELDASIQASVRKWDELIENRVQEPMLDMESDSLVQMLNKGTDPSLPPLIALTKSNYGFVYDIKDTVEVIQYLIHPDIRRTFPQDIIWAWSAKPDVDDDSQLLELYALRAHRDGAVLKGNIVSDAQQTFENGPSVSMAMNSEAAARWKRITKENVGRRIAIVLDGLVYTAPVVQSEIPTGQSNITGDFTVEEAMDLANILKTGKMPAKMNIVEEAVVGPTLGTESISRGFISLLSGLGLVIVFMTFYYGRGGSIANVALFINIIWILGILAQFGASLTLPGIAGLVLTIGMAVDANVLIFERIREELRNGRPLAQAVQAGYNKAYSSILDSNITTFLTGFILYVFGTGGIKGFATVLMIGVVCSVLSAVFVTRLILERMLKRKRLHENSFTSIFTRKWTFTPMFDFIRRRKLAYLLSGAVIVVGLMAVIANGGYNLGVDFKGGRSFIVEFETPVSAQKVKDELAKSLAHTSIEVKTYNSENILKIITSYLVDDASSEADDKVKAAITNGLEKLNPSGFRIIGSSKVGPTIADDFKEASSNAVIFALIVIFLYIFIRFRRWQYGLGATIALLHDVLMILAIYAILGLFGLHLEVDQVFIAAILTIIGYSINDTVVVFDRIREFSGTVTGEYELEKALNPAINKTLSRTVITSLTVLIVVLVLLIFGGDTLKGFSIALLTGVIFGTYSSIFIASPIVLDFSTKKDKRTEKPNLRPERRAA